MEALHREHDFSDLFVAYLLARNIRYEEDVVDQLFNSSEKRLARILLLPAHFGKEGKPDPVRPPLDREYTTQVTVMAPKGKSEDPKARGSSVLLSPSLATSIGVQPS